VARNRKRAKERRARRPQPVGRRAREELSGPPGPLEHAAPNAEIAEQAELPPNPEGLEVGEADVEADEVVYEDELEPSGEGGGGGSVGVGAGFGDGEDGGGGAESAAPSPIAEPRPHPGSRVLTFLEGSWRELQRVQWPDRRQVMQATGVVLGFVIVAGIWLGISDWGAKHIVNFILYGHF